MEQRSCPMGKPMCEKMCAWFVGDKCAEIIKLEVMQGIWDELKNMNDIACDKGKKKK